MRAVSVSRKVPQLKTNFVTFLQAGKTLFSVVSYYLKGSGECSKNLCHARGGGAIHSHKNRKKCRRVLSPSSDHSPEN